MGSNPIRTAPLSGSSVGLERNADTVEVGGSSPSQTTSKCPSGEIGSRARLKIEFFGV